MDRAELVVEQDLEVHLDKALLQTRLQLDQDQAEITEEVETVSSVLMLALHQILQMLQARVLLVLSL
jgi:hypothetical protein